MVFLSPGRIRSVFAIKPGQNAVLALVTQRRKAWPWLCDTLGHINNARYVDLLQDGRLEWLIQTGLLRPVMRQRMAFLVAGMGGVYRHDIPRMADFVLLTRVCAFDARWIYFEQTFRLGREGEGKVAARFITRGMIRARGGALPPRESLKRCGGVLPEVSAEAPTDLDAWCRAQDACLDVLRTSSPSAAAE